MPEHNPTVTIGDGQLQGSTKIDWLGRKYYSFQGIPFAKPPLGNLRFKAPQPPEPWKGIRDATKEGSSCYSRHLVYQHLAGSEDCLYLNVYTPQLPSTNQEPKPVMVWIHGGAFIGGSGNTEFYGPEFLVSQDVILVTINYRLGLLGFANFTDPSLSIPGNAALKDQVLALKWVQKNISAFGGENNNVTIFGESAGGASVHLLILSPMAKGLFHRAICHSGVATSEWGKGMPTAPLVAKALGLDKSTESYIVQKLNELSVEKLFEVQEKIPEAYSISECRPFGPVVESGNKESPFLSEEPVDIINKGNYNQVPVMMGYNSKEGMLLEFVQKTKFGEVKWITDFENAIPFYCGLTRGSDLSKKIADKIQQFYYGNEVASHDNINQYYSVHTDTYFFIAINSAVKEHTRSSSSPVYYLRMSLDTRLNMFKKLSGIKNAGACHGDDIGYLFKNALTPEIRPNSPEDIGLRRILKLWTTFAKYGDPNPPENDNLINITWAPTENNKLHYLDIGENLTTGINPEIERVEFWNEVFRLCSMFSKL